MSISAENYYHALCVYAGRKLVPGSSEKEADIDVIIEQDDLGAAHIGWWNEARIGKAAPADDDLAREATVERIQEIKETHRRQVEKDRVDAMPGRRLIRKLIKDAYRLADDAAVTKFIEDNS
jgi:hypothetical protein